MVMSLQVALYVGKF